MSAACDRRSPRVYEFALRALCCGFSVGVVGYGLTLARLASGQDFLNSYPFISADGFDWLYEGHALREHFLGRCAQHLPLLREPGFVLVSLLDAALHARGLVVILSHTVSFLVTGIVLIETARFYRTPAVLAGASVIILSLTPLNIFRLFVLADPMAVALLTASSYGMLKHLRTGSHAALWASGVLAIIGGMTQSYAAIAFLVGAVVADLTRAVRIRESRRQVVVISVSLGAVAACLIGLKLAWRAAIPHDGTPMQVGLLRLSFAMAPFYAQAWSFVYGPLIPFIAGALLLWRVSGRRYRPEVGYLGATTLLFAVLTFLYRFPETRLTFFYQPIVLQLLLAFSSRDPDPSSSIVTPLRRRLASAAAVCSAILVTMQLGFTPSSAWRPEIDTIVWRPGRSWVLLAWTERPVDRFGIGILGPEVSYSKAVIPADMGRYPKTIVSSYLALRQQGTATCQ